jgi:hypothetical protein
MVVGSGHGAGCPIRRARKAAVRGVGGSVIAFPCLTHPRAGLSHAEWRALGPGEKLERLFSTSLDDLYEIMSWEPIAELDPARLSVRMRVTRTVFTICVKTCLDGKLDHMSA